LVNVMHRISDLSGVGVCQFKANSIVRHPLVSKVVERID